MILAPALAYRGSGGLRQPVGPHRTSQGPRVVALVDDMGEVTRVRRYMGELSFGVTAVACTAAVGALVISTPGTFNQWLGALLVLVVALHVLLLPTVWLPSMALLIHVLVPAPPIPLLPSNFTPSLAVLILCAWSVRRMTDRYLVIGGVRLHPRHLVMPSVFMVWIVLSALTGSEIVASGGWVFAIFTGLVMFAMLPVDDLDADLLLRTWVVAACLLSLHVFVETILQADFVYGWFYEQLGVGSIQHWSTYRPEASFRHPLSAALFLSVAAMIAVGQAIRWSRGLYWPAALICSSAAVLTLSRGALIALLLGYIFIWIMWRPRHFPGFSWLRHISAAVVALGLTCIMSVGPLADRLASAEASRSTDTRLEVLKIAWSSAWAYGPLGAGPDRSQAASAPFNPSGIPIESSFLQLLISIGLVGLLLFVALMALVLIKAMRRGNLAASAGLLTFLIAIAFFNVLEQRESLIVLGGLLVLACSAPRNDASSDQASTPPNDSPVIRRPVPTG